jgi:hypothetical protein
MQQKHAERTVRGGEDNALRHARGRGEGMRRSITAHFYIYMAGLHLCMRTEVSHEEHGQRGIDIAIHRDASEARAMVGSVGDGKDTAVTPIRDDHVCRYIGRSV